jgi:GWxTD domain-containing protein
LLAALGLASCRAPASPPAAAAREWASGPVAWLLLPEEIEALEAIREPADLPRFLTGFWERRDPTPGSADNPFLLLFHQRVAAADGLYAETRRRGALTDRGGVLVLFGAPPVLRTSRRKVPAPVTRVTGPRRATGWVAVEEWAYPRRTLDERLLALFADGESELVFSFVEQGGRMRLAGGRDLLARAARCLAGAPL